MTVTGAQPFSGLDYALQQDLQAVTPITPSSQHVSIRVEDWLAAVTELIFSTRKVAAVGF